MKGIFGGAVYLSLAAGIWGGMYVVSKYALDTIPPFTLLFLRYLIASFLLGWICWLKREELVPTRERWLIFQIGFVGYFLSIAAQFIGTKLSSAHMGAVITTLSPVFLSAFAVLLLKEKITVKQVVSIDIALTGVLVVVGMPGLQGEGSALAGDLFLLAAALFWGYYSVLSRKLRPFTRRCRLPPGALSLPRCLPFPAFSLSSPIGLPGTWSSYPFS
ncbi:hypothetical protein P378_10570 [Desulforamulus profundi]|uniref:EamA domain-containing protein n=1 Tax=Desulforamulus profundi TaxID=1383067 RepID=A0A2C6M7Q0_9FIRM|nr:DMT family transporter [Desulforamulus profundi]PHJ38267.1 hypothetical protein P378_10570 [Desulforamulus profundi]